MVLLVIGAMMFLFGSIYNISQGEAVEAMGGLVIAIIMLGTHYYIKIEKNKAQNFIEWAMDNQTEIREGTAIFEGARVDLDTEVTQYQACFSFLFLSVKVPSRFYVKDYHYTLFISLLYSLYTLFFGWWGLPLGPIYTVQSLIRNMFGGKKKTIRELLAEHSDMKLVQAKVI